MCFLLLQELLPIALEVCIAEMTIGNPPCFTILLIKGIESTSQSLIVVRCLSVLRIRRIVIIYENFSCWVHLTNIFNNSNFAGH